MKDRRMNSVERKKERKSAFKGVWAVTKKKERKKQARCLGKKKNRRRRRTEEFKLFERLQKSCNKRKKERKHQ